MAGNRSGSFDSSEFFFLGNHLALDFLNTRPVLEGEPVDLLADFPAVVRWSRAAGLLDAGQAAALEEKWGGTSRAAQFVTALRSLRERLRQAVQEWEKGHPVRPGVIDELNRLMANYPLLTRLTRSGKGLAVEQYLEICEPEDLSGPLAHAAATLFASIDHEKVRQCARCVLHFHDTSRKGTRRWCSMQLCGNRVKVAAYSARRRSHSSVRD